MHTESFNLAVIIGSTREGRFGDKVAAWFVEQVCLRDDMVLDLIDLAEAGLPAVLMGQPEKAVEAFTRRIDQADAVVLVTPEYNHGYPASLKQALDSARSEWQAKPVGFVSYGGIAGGLRAVEQLRQVCAELHMVSMRDGVSFHMAHNLFDGEGRLIDVTAPNSAAQKLLRQLHWWGVALKEARDRQPYSSVLS